MEFRIEVEEENGRRYGRLIVQACNKLPKGKSIRKPLDRSGDPSHHYNLGKIFPLSCHPLGNMTVIIPENTDGLVADVAAAKPEETIVFSGRII